MACKIILTVALLGLLARQAAANVGQWHMGRATFFGKDGWSIHEGSCEYYYLDKDVGTGWDVAAMGDQNWDYGGSCGKCKEVKCKAANFKDGYGQFLERSNVCYDTGASTVVTIVDTCACVYPGNQYSNKRWCCGDMYHLDLSLWAYEKLADTKWGVIAIDWRDVPCDFKVNKRAWAPNGASGPERGPPGGWHSGLDKRPWSAKRKPNWGRRHLLSSGARSSGKMLRAA